MQNWNRLPRVLLFIPLLTGLLGSMIAPTLVDESVGAAPMALPATGVVISELRSRGPSTTNSATDEFIELYNPTGGSISIAGWTLRRSSGCGTTVNDIYTIGSGVSLASGQHYLIGGTNYTGLITPDVPSVSISLADTGGIALFDTTNTIVDQVGACNTLPSHTLYHEGMELAPTTSMTTDRSYERGLGGLSGSCMDNGNNLTDFTIRTPSDPQNSSSSPIVCTGTTNVSSTTADGAYTIGSTIIVTITFSGIVNVDTTNGTPTLLLNTGTIDETAIYSAGSGSNTLIFNYIVAPGDISNDLDYVATNSLSLNGGTITGATGDAVLVLPSPGSSGSLGSNKAIVIDAVPPGITSFTRQTPGSASTNADALIFRATFSEDVTGVDVADFMIHDNTPASNTTAIVTNVSSVSNSVYDVTVSGGDLAGFNGAIGLDFSATPTIKDLIGFDFAKAEPTTDEVYTVDNVAPTVTVNQATGQADPATSLWVRFAVVFSEPIDNTTFTPTDITQGGTATGITWNITDSGDHINFALSATAVSGSGTLIPSIAANQVTDLAGNNNTASTKTDNIVDYTNVVTPLSIVINEVAWAGTSSARIDDEWIELYNPGASEINLNGWSLKADDGISEVTIASFSSSDKIPARDYFLLARLASGGDCDGTYNINIFTDVVEDKCFSVQLTNNPNGQALRLYNSGGTVIDTANSDRGNWPAGTAASTYNSMERRRVEIEGPTTWATFGGTPFAHNRDGVLVRGTPKRSNWVLTITPTPAPTPTSKPARKPTPTFVPLVGRMIINEYLPRPGFDWNQDGLVNVKDEFIEIKNLGPVNVSLNGWRLDVANQSSAPFQIPPMTVKPDQRVIFYGSTTGILLSDGGDTVRLLNSFGKVIDAHTYSIAKEADRSWCRFPDAINNIYWKKNCLPTPGLVNALIGEVPSGPPDTGLEVPLCLLPDTLLSDYLLAECSTGFGGGIWNSMYWDKPGWLSQHPIYDDKNKWLSFVE